MHLNPHTGLWEQDSNDYIPPKTIEELNEPEEEEKVIFNGVCTLSIRFESPDEYVRWKHYEHGRKWEFNVDYPAIMRAEYEFHKKSDVERMAMKIVDLLQNGFDVYSASWKLDKEEK